MTGAASARPVVFCFAGQGAQYFRMAADLYEQEPVFRDWMRIGDALLRDRFGYSLIAEIYGPDRRIGDPFDRLALSHPALFLVQYAAARAVMQRGLRPDLLLGVSLGEFVAMTVAGMMPFEEALLHVAGQPARFEASCPPGGMIAVLAPPALWHEMPVLARDSEVAGISAGGHFVLSAPAGALAPVEAELRARSVAFQRLPVGFAFHSRWIDPAAEACRAADAGLRLAAPFWPCWSSCLGRPLDPAAPPPDFAWRIVREPMDLRGCFTALEEQGVEGRGGVRYVDLSPSGTLAALARQNMAASSASQTLALLSPFGGNMKRLEEVTRN
ncbi:MAG: acyltransferase domain-containing protein [Oceanibaculum sp.]